MKTKDTIISVWWRGQNWSALVKVPVDRTGKAKMSSHAMIRAIEEANGIKIGRNDGIALGGL
jgi:hypothetical protein